MMSFDVKEYHSVILGALLHDTGKLLHRARGGGGEKHEKHEEASLRFVQDLAGKLRNEKLYDMDIVRLLVEHHHSLKREALQDRLFSGKSRPERERLWKLVALIKRADTYSCAERDRDQQWKKEIEKRKAPLDAIFSTMSLADSEGEKENGHAYHLAPLTPLESFPERLKALSDEEIKETADRLYAETPDLSQLTHIDDVLNGLLSTLESCTWAVPSDTRYEISDVSLFDHLRSTAAIAACLYKRHMIALEQGRKFESSKEIILIGGDFSGIQRYIFDITNKGSGGASKRLRARSLFISLFSEATIHKILHSLELPLVCNIFSTAGKFLLLAPNIEGVVETLQTVKSEIEAEIQRTFFGQFAYLMSWMEIKGFKTAFKIHNFFDVADEMFHRLETEKLRNFRTVLIDGAAGSWNSEAFKASRIYEQYKDTGDCAICGKGPGICEDKDQETDDSIFSCPVCHRDKHVIGAKLPKSRYIAFKRTHHGQEEGEKQIPVFAPGAAGESGYSVELSKHGKPALASYLLYDIGGSRARANGAGEGRSLRKHIANHVPLGPDNRVLSFEEIAAHSIWRKGEKLYGSDFLGILKADVDNLGLLFSKGFEKPAKSDAKLNVVDRKTVSRFLTLSRMMDLFFSGWVRDTMAEGHKETVLRELTSRFAVRQDRLAEYINKETIDFAGIYTVYSGGDDLVLVGPWETMIIFAIFLDSRFRGYTCNNDSITLSAGLTFVKPRLPIAAAIRQADQLLDQSKQRGKNRITFFGTTLEWHKLADTMDFFLFLDERLTRDDSKISEINTSFLHRLLEYHRMASEKSIHRLRYLSALSYDIGRNLVKWNEDGKIVKGREDYQALQPLLDLTRGEDSLIFNLKAPLFWALYRHRKARREEASR